MSTSRLKQDTKQQILSSMEKMAHYITKDGMTPDDALYKAVKEANFQPPTVRLMAQAYNCGKSINQRQESKSIFSKTANFQLCDGDAVVDRLLNSKDCTHKIGSAIDPVYYQTILWDRTPNNSINSDLNKTAARKKLLMDSSVKGERPKRRRRAALQRDENVDTGKAMQKRKIHRFEDMGRSVDEGDDRYDTDEERRRIEETRQIGFDGFQVKRPKRHFYAGKEASSKYIFDEFKQAAYNINLMSDNIKNYLCKQARLSDAEIAFGCDRLFDRMGVESLQQATEGFYKVSTELPLRDREYRITEEPFCYLNSLMKSAVYIDHLLKRGDVITDGIEKVRDLMHDTKASGDYVPDIEELYKRRRRRLALQALDLLTDDEVLDKEEPENVINSFNRALELTPTLGVTGEGAKAVVHKFIAQNGQTIPELREVIDAEAKARPDYKARDKKED